MTRFSLERYDAENCVDPYWIAYDNKDDGRLYELQGRIVNAVIDQLDNEIDGLTDKVSDLRTQIASLTAENKRFRDLLEHIRDRILEPPYTEARMATQDVDIVRWIEANLNPKPEETA